MCAETTGAAAGTPGAAVASSPGVGATRNGFLLLVVSMCNRLARHIFGRWGSQMHAANTRWHSCCCCSCCCCQRETPPYGTSAQVAAAAAVAAPAANIECSDNGCSSNLWEQQQSDGWAALAGRHYLLLLRHALQLRCWCMRSCPTIGLAGWPSIVSWWAACTTAGACGWCLLNIDAMRAASTLCHSGPLHMIGCVSSAGMSLVFLDLCCVQASCCSCVVIA